MHEVCVGTVRRAELQQAIRADTENGSGPKLMQSSAPFDRSVLIAGGEGSEADLVVHEQQRPHEGRQHDEGDNQPRCGADVGRADVPPSDAGGARREDQYHHEPRHVPRIR